jgi:hypothetical protein
MTKTTAQGNLQTQRRATAQKGAAPPRLAAKRRPPPPTLWGFGGMGSGVPVQPIRIGNRWRAAMGMGVRASSCWRGTRQFEKSRSDPRLCS